MDGWMDGWESGFKDCLQQSKILCLWKRHSSVFDMFTTNSESFNHLGIISRSLTRFLINSRIVLIHLIAKMLSTKIFNCVKSNQVHM